MRAAIVAEVVSTRAAGTIAQVSRKPFARSDRTVRLSIGEMLDDWPQRRTRASRSSRWGWASHRREAAAATTARITEPFASEIGTRDRGIVLCRDRNRSGAETSVIVATRVVEVVDPLVAADGGPALVSKGRLTYGRPCRAFVEVDPDDAGVEGAVFYRVVHAGGLGRPTWV